MKNIDPNDASFIENLKELAGIDVKGIDDLIPKLDPEILIDIAAAVTNGDKKTVLRLITSGRIKVMAERKDKAAKKRRDNIKQGSLDDHFSDLNIGDAVKFDDEEGTVKISKGPGDTVGIMIDGKLEMVDRKSVTKVIEEGMIGMASIPDLRRMQALAGIHGDENLDTESVEVEVEPEIEEEEEDCAETALCMLDKIAAMLPALRFSDVKEIRKRLCDLTNQINESSDNGSSVRRRKI